MSATTLHVHMLGELTVVSNGRPKTVPGSRKTRALLAYLLLQNHPVSREHLCELLWPHPDDPRAALRWSLTKLRPLLNAETPHLVTDRASVSIEGLDDHIDLRRIDTLLVRPLDEIETADLEAAADLFRGELLEEMEIPDCHRFNQWLIARGEAARRSRRTILETLTARRADDPERALPFARARVALDPLDEGAHVDVVRLLGTLGRVDEAHGQAARCTEIMDAELGRPPGSELAKTLRLMKATIVAAPVVAAPRTPVLPPAPADAGLFGRAEECVQVEAFLEAQDRRPILFLEGEPGMGKSRLLAELRRRAVGRDLLVLTGRSWDVAMVRPFGVWIDLLAGLPHDQIAADLRADLAPLIPSLGEPLQHRVDMDRLTGALEHLVDRIHAAGRTVAFVFDDIHWIDPASTELLGRLWTGRVNDLFGIACAGRPGEFADNEAARSLLRNWNRSGRLNRVTVAPLTDRDAAALTRSMSDTVDVAHVVAACGGNPLYLIETVREGSGSSAGQVASLVGDRLAALDEPTRDIARWAAVMGRAFPATRMANLLTLPLPDLLAGAEILERHGILRPHGHEWDFAHDLLRRAVLADLSGPRRTLMHRRIARIMSAEPDPDGALAAEIAFHARRGGEPGLATAAAVTAGDHALRLAAFDDAWRVADRGLAEAAKLSAESAVEPSVELLRIQVLSSMGRRHADAMTELLTRLADQAHVADMPRAERTARWLLSIIAEEAGDCDAARRHSLSAQKAGRQADPRTRLCALANTARCLVQLEREPDRAADLLGEAKLLAESLRASVLDIPWGYGLLCAMQGRPEEAHAALAQGADLAREQENHWARFECLSRMSMLDLAAGNLDEVERRDGVLREAAEKLGEGSERALAATLLALARRRAGHDATELDEALARLRAADSKGLLAYALNEAGRLDLADGDHGAAARRAEEALKASGDVGRHHQHDRAMVLRARIALVEEDEETIDESIHRLTARLEKLSPGLSIHEELRRTCEDIINHKETSR